MLNILEIENNFCDCLIRLFIFLGHIMNIIKIGVPIILILLGSIDFIKAVVAQKDDEIKKTKNIFIKRLIYGVVIFFVISLVSFGVGLVGGDTNNRCFKCVADVNSEKCDKNNIPSCKKKTETKEEKETKPEEKEEWYFPTNEDNTEECEVLFSGALGGEFDIYLENNRIRLEDYGEIVDENGNRITDIKNLSVEYLNDILFEETPQLEMIVTNRLKPGKYENLSYITKAFMNTVDSILIEPNAKLVIYEKENYEGKVLLEETGPKIIYNVAHSNSTVFKNFLSNIQTYSIRFPNYNQGFSTWEFYDYSALAEYISSLDGNPIEPIESAKRHHFGSFKIYCKK